jgi:hypothetical protein
LANSDGKGRNKVEVLPLDIFLLDTEAFTVLPDIAPLAGNTVRTVVNLAVQAAQAVSHPLATVTACKARISCSQSVSGSPRNNDRSSIDCRITYTSSIGTSSIGAWSPVSLLRHITSQLPLTANPKPVILNLHMGDLQHWRPTLANPH